MPIFSQPQDGQSNPFEEQQKVINEIVRRVNDIDRRVRLNEQENMNQKQTINNMNENFVKLRDEILERIKNVEEKAGLDKIEMMEKTLNLIKEKAEAMPSRVEMAKIKSFVASAAPKEGTELDDALLAIEMLGGSKGEAKEEKEKIPKKDTEKKKEEKKE